MSRNTEKLQEILLEKIKSYEPLTGNAVLISESLQNAFMMSPRHLFLNQFRMVGEHSNSRICSVEDPDSMAIIYENHPLVYVDEQGHSYPSSNSEPDFIFYLLALLDLQPGQRVLEIGCGTGWLLSIISEVVGSDGRVVGVEIIEELALQAEKNIRNKGLRNVEIVSKDITALDGFDTLFDRIIVTCSCYEIPDQLMQVLKKGGRLILPLRNKGLAQEVVLMERTILGLESVRSQLSVFVPIVSNQFSSDLSGIREFPTDKFWNDITQSQSKDQKFQFTPLDTRSQLFTALPFTSYLSKTEPEFAVFSLPSRITGHTLPESLIPLSEKIGVNDRKARNAIRRNMEQSKTEILWSERRCGKGIPKCV